VEGAIAEHPHVAEVAVTGAPDEDLGERIVAWVVVRAGSELTADEVMAHTRSLLASHKRPREVRFLAELPRNALGKVVKTRLTDQPVGADLPAPHTAN
jgi:malonyl-CoA/methylmalonyl-CoA synthetase